MSGGTPLFVWVDVAEVTLRAKQKKVNKEARQKDATLIRRYARTQYTKKKQLINK
jgi:hypothetical protein